ncbi:glycine zipper family protein [Veronia nyctiphanis]|uniref:Glycine zipper family protein n=1 Tax=Veronia nyctiphanis TaxID=1278244 RepID=A0A4Q0YMW5_9GAMM|nr:glycine zipper family protein [Veronia nyctiphanis]RXJ72126.1 glycine zipper family protein [Veronia nyctiphanis]
MKHILCIFISVVFLAGCAYNQKPVVDLEGVDKAKYDKDFAYCQRLAEQVDESEAAKTEAANSSVSGAIIGAISGVINDGVGGAVTGAAVGGAIGGGAGAIQGANNSTKDQAKVLRRCLRDRGYKVYDI